VGIIFTSFRWGDQQPTKTEGFDFRLQDYVQRTVCSRGLKLAVLYDATATPSWLLEQYPDAVLVDAYDVVRRDVSFHHADAMQHVHEWLGAALAQLASVNNSCIHSIQPSFNNEYETKYTQVCPQQDAHVAQLLLLLVCMCASGKFQELKPLACVLTGAPPCPAAHALRWYRTVMRPRTTPHPR